MADQKQFKRAAIVRIELQNFMIYKHIELKPGPFLNLIIGPNGSGKSAIVCAIIIGFGGDPQITGRSSALIDYIRFGSQTAEIAIEINSGSEDEENYLIQRILRSTLRNGKKDCSTTWKLNGDMVDKARILKFISDLHIDINNLCQVLPQERVVEFAKMSPKQLLVSTEKSIGDVDMYDRHMKLISLSEKISELQEKIKDCNAFIMKYQNFKSNIEPDLKLIQQKKKFEEEISWLEKKRVWLEYEEKRNAYVNTKNVFTKKKDEYKEFSEKLKPIKTLIKSCDESVFNARKSKNKTNETIKRQLMKANDLFRKQDENVDKINDLIAAYNEKLSEQKRMKSRLNQYEQDLKNYRNDLLNYNDQDQFKEQVASLERELASIESEMRQMSSDIESNRTKYDNFAADKRRLENRIRSINDVFHKKIDKLSLNDSSTKTACEWLEKNKDRFKGKVFPPIITQVNVIKPEWVKFVETAIGANDMSTFLFEDKEDLQTFSSCLETEHNIRVNMAMIPRDTEDYECNFDVDQYRSYGIFASVRDLFTAPPEVMSYLCKNYKLNSIPVGNDKTDSQMQDLLNSSPFRRIMSSKNLYIIVVSVYDKQKTTRIVPLNNPRYLDLIIDQKEADRVKAAMENVNKTMSETTHLLEKMTQKFEIIKDRHENKSVEVNSFKLRKNAISAIESKIREKERQIEKLKNSIVPFNRFKPELKDNLQKIHESQHKLLLELSQINADCHDKSKEIIVVEVKFNTFANLKTMYEKSLSTLNVEDLKRRQELKDLDEKLQEIRDIAKEFREKAKRFSGFDFNDSVDNSIVERFESMPSSLDEIKDSVNMLKLRCEGIVNIDESILEEYQKYQQEITEKTSYSAQLEKELEANDKKINELKAGWIESLNDLILKINNNFGKFMDYLRYSGEVYLYTGSKEYAFDDYGIRIKVKFRDSEPMKDLDAYHQSGGERSVSTMIYMLSLQELANVPFRVVDEINQGMDETNERFVFDLIAEVSRKNSSQYFLLSPKLLPNLNYTPEMKVHIIFNGPHIYVNWNNVFANLLTE